MTTPAQIVCRSCGDMAPAANPPEGWHHDMWGEWRCWECVRAEMEERDAAEQEEWGRREYGK